MFGKSKDKHEKMPLAGPVVLTDPTSSISRGVTVVGNIFGAGTVQVFGRIEGNVRASTVLIDEGAQVEGDLVAEELTIAGRVKGIIRGNRVKLVSTAFVEGDIFHRSLSIDENARFEGLSKREDNAGDMPGSGKSLRDALQAPPAYAPGEAFSVATALRGPAAHDVAPAIAEAGSPLSRSSTQDESQTNVTPIDAVDRVQHALGLNAVDRVQRAIDVVAALGGGSRLTDLSPTAPPAELKGRTGEHSSSPVSSPAIVPSDTESDGAKKQ
jgi:cytoskeletal protein CcmA (bactofilin family)